MNQVNPKKILSTAPAKNHPLESSPGIKQAPAAKTQSSTGSSDSFRSGPARGTKPLTPENSKAKGPSLSFADDESTELNIDEYLSKLRKYLEINAPHLLEKFDEILSVEDKKQSRKLIEELLEDKKFDGNLSFKKDFQKIIDAKIYGTALDSQSINGSWVEGLEDSRTEAKAISNDQQDRSQANNNTKKSGDFDIRGHIETSMASDKDIIDIVKDHAPEIVEQMNQISNDKSPEENTAIIRKILANPKLKDNVEMNNMVNALLFSKAATLEGINSNAEELIEKSKRHAEYQAASIKNRYETAKAYSDLRNGIMAHYIESLAVDLGDKINHLGYYSKGDVNMLEGMDSEIKDVEEQAKLEQEYLTKEFDKTFELSKMVKAMNNPKSKGEIQKTLLEFKERIAIHDAITNYTKAKIKAGVTDKELLKKEIQERFSNYQSIDFTKEDLDAKIDSVIKGAFKFANYEKVKRELLIELAKDPADPNKKLAELLDRHKNDSDFDYEAFKSLLEKHIAWMTEDVNSTYQDLAKIEFKANRDAYIETALKHPDLKTEDIPLQREYYQAILTRVNKDQPPKESTESTPKASPGLDTKDTDKKQVSMAPFSNANSLFASLDLNLDFNSNNRRKKVDDEWAKALAPRNS